MTELRAVFRVETVSSRNGTSPDDHKRRLCWTAVLVSTSGMDGNESSQG